MPRYETTRRVRHSAATMFALVADVERYPEFVPMCESLVIRRRVPGENDQMILTAAMTVGYKFLRETFTSRVTLEPAQSKILVEYIDGPIEHLRNRWTFTPIGETECDVGFYIEYEFRSRAFRAIAGAVFDSVFRRMAEAFEKRADDLAARGKVRA